MDTNPYASPSSRPLGGITLARLALLLLIGSAISWAILVPLFSLSGTGAARSLVDFIVAIPLPGDQPDPRGPTFDHWNPWRR